MAGLAFAMRGLPIGTAYAVWVGIGAVLTVTYAMASGAEPLNALKVVFLVMIVGGVVGLKLALPSSGVAGGEPAPRVVAASLCSACEDRALGPCPRALACDHCWGNPNRRSRLVMPTARARNIPTLAIAAR